MIIRRAGIIIRSDASACTHFFPCRQDFRIMHAEYSRLECFIYILISSRAQSMRLDRKPFLSSWNISLTWMLIGVAPPYPHLLPSLSHRISLFPDFLFVEAPSLSRSFSRAPCQGCSSASVSPPYPCFNIFPSFFPSCACVLHNCFTILVRSSPPATSLYLPSS